MPGCVLVSQPTSQAVVLCRFGVGDKVPTAAATAAARLTKLLPQNVNMIYKFYVGYLNRPTKKIEGTPTTTIHNKAQRTTAVGKNWQKSDTATGEMVCFKCGIL